MRNLLLLSMLSILSKVIFASDFTIFVEIVNKSEREEIITYNGEDYKNVRIRVIPGVIKYKEGEKLAAIKSFPKIDLPVEYSSSLQELSFSKKNEYLNKFDYPYNYPYNYLSIIVTADKRKPDGFRPAIVSEETLKYLCTSPSHELKNVKIDYHGEMKFLVSSKEVDLYPLNADIVDTRTDSERMVDDQMCEAVFFLMGEKDQTPANKQ